jgi:anaphase-promoting complex subunit 1
VQQSYGVHMAVSLAIGCLFLGGACCKFSTDPKSVAVLLLAMWPALPASPTDNRCHLQARSCFS